jgi:hypothetical protein
MAENLLILYLNDAEEKIEVGCGKLQYISVLTACGVTYYDGNK